MTIRRAHYRERQVLRYTDFADEQAYRIAMRRRHNLAHHGWGIVQGLVLTASVSGVRLSAGFAIDGYGRELSVAQALELRQPVLEEVLNGATAGYIDVWLSYHIQASDAAQEPCYEDAWLRLDCADPERLTEPRYPPEVALADLGFTPERQPPDDPAREWPVYLGRIIVGGGNVSLPPHSRNLIDRSERVYADLAGASVHTAAGFPWLQLGDEESADQRRFAIALPDADGKSVDRLSLDREGGTILRGDARLAPAGTSPLEGDGDLNLSGIAPDLGYGGGIQWDALQQSPTMAQAWQLYRTSIEVTQGTETLPVEQLRMETFHPGEEGDPTRAAWVVGEIDESHYSPFMSIRSDGSVIIEGNLLVEGQLIEGAIPADVEDERFRDELLGRWTKGLTLAGTEVDAYYEQPLQVTVVTLPNNGTVQYDVTIAHTIGSEDRDVPIVSVLSEFRNDDRLLIYTESLNLETRPDGTPNNNPLEPGQDMQLRSTVDLGTVGAVTLTVRVFSLGVAQNTVEKSATKVIDLS
jgi:hypothetical protein